MAVRSTHARRRRRPPRQRRCRVRPPTRRRSAAGDAVVATLRGRRARAERPSSDGRDRGRDLYAYYGAFRAVKNISLQVKPHAVTAIIGPSGCGKSTFLRTLNRMHELTPGAHVEGRCSSTASTSTAPTVDPVQLRRGRRDGLPATQPIPDDVDLRQRRRRASGSPAAIRRPSSTRSPNGASAGRPSGTRSRTSSSQNGMSLSGGQQQRLCIARALAVGPGGHPDGRAGIGARPGGDAADRGADGRAPRDYTIVIVTHNMQQASRVSDQTAFFTMGEDRAGYLVEIGRRPSRSSPTPRTS